MEKSSYNWTDEEHEILKQFRKNVADILSYNDTDTILLKWLKSRNFNLKKSELYFREMYAFKQLYNIETSTTTYVKPQVAEKYEYSSFMGYAKNGSVIRYNPVGRGDHNGFIRSLTPYELGLYAANIMENDLDLQRKHNKKLGLDVNEIIYIFDLDGIALQDLMHKCVYESALDLGRLVQDYYPDIWGHIFFINAPSYFDRIYNIFKPILRMSLIESIQLISRDSTTEVLLKYIDEDVLPVFLGGKKVDSNGNPKCTEFLKFGGKIPTNYYLANRPHIMTTDPGVEYVWVRARSVFNYPLVIHKPNTTIRVELRTEYGSIYMSVFYRKFGPGPDEIDLPAPHDHLDEKDEKCRVQKISPGLRVQTHLCPINDSNLAPWPGIYIFRFNNSHSWFMSRRLIFRISAA